MHPNRSPNLQPRDILLLFKPNMHTNPAISAKKLPSRVARDAAEESGGVLPLRRHVALSLGGPNPLRTLAHVLSSLFPGLGEVHGVCAGCVHPELVRAAGGQPEVQLQSRRKVPSHCKRRGRLPESHATGEFGPLTWENSAANCLPP